MSPDRAENRRKRLKLLLIFGCASSAVAMSAAIFAWAWGSGGTNWVLPPQTIADETPQKVDKRWASLQMPVATISGPMTANRPEAEPQSDEIAVMAELGSTFASIQPSAGESEPPPASYESYTGLGSLNVGSGRSWRGTFHPNRPGPGALSFPNYSSGGVGSGSSSSPSPASRSMLGPCEGPDAQNKLECQTQLITDPKPKEPDPKPKEPGETCGGWTSTVSIPGQSLNDQANCGQQDVDDDDDPPPPAAGGPISCLSEEGCDTGGIGGNNPIIAIAEPGSLALLLSGLAGLLALRRRR